MDVREKSGGALFRVVTIGDSSVGKTSFINQLTNSGFDPNEPATIGANFVIYVEETSNGRVEMQIWDTAGQERFKSLGPIYYRNSAAAIVVFDLTNMDTFTALPEWINSFLDIAGPKAIVMVIGNKRDLVIDDFNDDQARTWAESNGYLYFNTSAMTGDGIKESMAVMAERLSVRCMDETDVAARISSNKKKNARCCK